MDREREQAVRERAYAIWEEEGRPEGRRLAHWWQAQVEIGSASAVAVVKDSKPIKSRRARVVTNPAGEARTVH